MKDILRCSPEEWDAGLARLRAAMSEPAELWEADAGDVITIPGHWPAKVTVLAVEYGGRDYRGREFSWLAWADVGARGREWYPDLTRIGMVSRADRPPADDAALAGLRAALASVTCIACATDPDGECAVCGKPVCDDHAVLSGYDRFCFTCREKG
jgi:hypothetical protein